MFDKKEQRQELTEAFQIFDPDQTRKILASELKVIMRSLGFKDITKKEVERLIRDYGYEDGRIEFSDYMDLSQLNSGEKIQ